MDVVLREYCGEIRFIMTSYENTLIKTSKCDGDYLRYSARIQQYESLSGTMESARNKTLSSGPISSNTNVQLETCYCYDFYSLCVAP